MESLTATPLYRSLTRTSLLLGADRELVLVSAILLCFAALMALGVASLFLVVAPLALVLWCCIVFGLRVVAKSDPLYRQVYVRNSQYPPVIRSSSTPFRR